MLFFEAWIELGSDAGTASFLFYLLGLLIIGNMYDPSPLSLRKGNDHSHVDNS